MAKRKIAVSELFVEAYMNFNVTDQVASVASLSDREKYLLLLCAIDKHNEDDPVVLSNLKAFHSEIMELRKVQDDRVSTVEAIRLLAEETGDRYIDTDCLVDGNGRKLKSPLTRQQVREEKIKRITKK